MKDSEFSEGSRTRRCPGGRRCSGHDKHWISFYKGEGLHEELGDLPLVSYEELNIRRDNTPILSAT